MSIKFSASCIRMVFRSVRCAQREGCSLFIMLILVATVVARGPTESSARTGRRTGAIIFLRNSATVCPCQSSCWLDAWGRRSAGTDFAWTGIIGEARRNCLSLTLANIEVSLKPWSLTFELSILRFGTGIGIWGEGTNLHSNTVAFWLGSKFSAF